MVLTVLRWTAAGIAALLVLAAVVNFGLYIAVEAPALLQRLGNER